MEKNEFEELACGGRLGFYNICEVTNVFLIQKKTKQIYHFFALFSMEERIDIREKDEFLLDVPQSINKEYSMGIERYTMTVEAAQEVFMRLRECSGKMNGTVDIGKGELHIGKLRLLNQQFVPEDSTREIVLNKVLKNNFENGSYILEFFDEIKQFPGLSDTDKKRVAEIVLKHIPLDLYVLTDRIGNIIFQFPSQNFAVHAHGEETETCLEVSIIADERIENSMQQYYITADYWNDGIIIGSAMMQLEKLQDCVLRTGDTTKMCSFMVRDVKHGLILCQKSFTLIRQFHFTMNMGSEYGNIRRFRSEGEEIEVKIDSCENVKTGVDDPAWSEYVESRQYQQNMLELEKHKEFMQYCAESCNERERALNDIREIMNRGDNNPVYLWDPYLSAEDLLDTWYYTKYYGKPLKAITSKLCSDCCGMTVPEWIVQQKKILEERSNHYGISMEWRCQWNQKGYPFHDRFLLIGGKKPIGWSLGTSLNSVGKSHHIIQKVSDPQHIIDAFFTLWNKLDGEENLVWKRM